MRAPTTDTGLALAFVEFGGKYMWELGQVRVWAAPSVPTGGPETYLEVLEGLMERWGLAMAPHRGKDTDSEGRRKKI